MILVLKHRQTKNNHPKSFSCYFVLFSKWIYDTYISNTYKLILNGVVKELCTIKYFTHQSSSRRYLATGYFLVVYFIWIYIFQWLNVNYVAKMCAHTHTHIQARTLTFNIFSFFDHSKQKQEACTLPLLFHTHYTYTHTIHHTLHTYSPLIFPFNFAVFICHVQN